MLLRTLTVLAFACIDALTLQRPFQNSESSHNIFRTRDYSKEVVLRIGIDAEEDSLAVQKASTLQNLDIWAKTYDHIDVRISRDDIASFFDLLPDHVRNSTTYMISNLQQTISTAMPVDAASDFLNERIPSINDTFFSDYQTVEAINAWLNLVVVLHAPYASLIKLGTTHEGREIQGLKLAKPTSLLDLAKNKKRKVILVHGAQHAREWISVSTVCYLAYSLAAGAQSDGDVRHLVEDFDWIFIPTLNVDGYAYTFQDRLWRKNRQPTTLPFCKGLDLDRNWDYGWDTSSQRTQSSPCSENYQGEQAFEAHETRLLSEYIQSIHKDPRYKLVGYLDLHSYAQTILYPYALSCDIDVRDEESLIELGVGAGKAMKDRTGYHYDTASACDQDGHVLAASNSGAALDWVYHSGVPWSYVVKLRDTGSYGFLVPKDEIVPTGEEMLGFLKYFGSFISEHGK